MKQMEKKKQNKTGLNSPKPFCYKNAQDFISGPRFCLVLTLLKTSF